MANKTVFIHTASADPHADSVARCLRELGVSVEILPRERCFLDWTIDCIGDDVWISKGDQAWLPSQIAAVYWRRDFLTEPSWVQHSQLSAEAIAFIADQRSMHVESAFKRLALSRPFLNNISANRLASSKALQHHMARQCGILVPDTFIGSDPGRARTFVQRLWSDGRRCCTKNLESVHVLIEGEAKARLTQLFEPEQAEELTGLPMCPMIFQEYVEKICEYRVTVVGSEVYACRIDSQCAGGETAIDWRNYNIPRTPHLAVELPACLSLKLTALVRELGLVYGAVDLVENRDHEILFLEVNSMGQWLWIEDLTGLPISQAIARHLAEAEHLPVYPRAAGCQ
jgi:glutathione synthase/RimK-type ligase-like ATP-grasp enzyme